jgi:hypothetical protein
MTIKLARAVPAHVAPPKWRLLPFLTLLNDVPIPWLH